MTRAQRLGAYRTLPIAWNLDTFHHARARYLRLIAAATVQRMAATTVRGIVTLAKTPLASTFGVRGSPAHIREWERVRGGRLRRQYGSSVAPTA